MASQAVWRSFLDGLLKYDEIVGVLVVDEEGTVVERRGDAGVFADGNEARRVAPNSEDVWVEVIDDRFVVVAFDRGEDVAPIQLAVERECEESGLA